MNRKIVAILLFTGLTLTSLLAQNKPMWQLPLKDRLEKHLYAISADSMKGRKAGSVEAQKAAQYIKNNFKEIGIVPFMDGDYLQPFKIDDKKGSFANVIGYIPSSDPIMESEFIVVGAHFDHLGVKEKDGKVELYNGADDNASGVAALIEIGRTLMERQGELKRSVLLIGFDAEEIGLHGSKYFIQNSPIPIDNIKLMVNVDMVGWLKESGKLTYFGSGIVKDGANLVTTDGIPEGTAVGVTRSEFSLFFASDADPFDKADVPTFNVTTGKKSPYHKPEDTADLIDYEGLAIATEHVTGVVVGASSVDEIKASTPIASKHKSGAPIFSFGLSMNVGANSHHYSKGPYNGKNKGFYSAGLYAQVKLNRSGLIALRPEVAYERSGANHPNGSAWTNAVAVPVNLVIGTPPLIPVGLELMLGGYYKHVFSGSLGRAKMDFNNAFYRNEAGLSWGVALKLAPISVGVRVRYALTNFTRERTAEGAHIRNRTTTLNVTYRF